MVTNIPVLQIYSFITLMCAGMGVNIVNAATVELYPTALRYLKSLAARILKLEAIYLTELIYCFICFEQFLTELWLYAFL